MITEIIEADLEKFLLQYNEKDYHQTYLSIKNAAKDMWKNPNG